MNLSDKSDRQLRKELKVLKGERESYNLFFVPTGSEKQQEAKSRLDDAIDAIEAELRRRAAVSPLERKKRRKRRKR
jgi:hypothetical protein